MDTLHATLNNPAASPAMLFTSYQVRGALRHAAPAAPAGADPRPPAQGLVENLRLLLLASSKKSVRQHTQGCLRALCQAQNRVFAAWRERKPQLAATMSLLVRNHNAQFQQIDVIQTHHSALARPAPAAAPHDAGRFPLLQGLPRCARVRLSACPGLRAAASHTTRSMLRAKPGWPMGGGRAGCAAPEQDADRGHGGPLPGVLAECQPAAPGARGRGVHAPAGDDALARLAGTAWLSAAYPGVGSACAGAGHSLLCGGTGLHAKGRRCRPSNTRPRPPELESGWSPAQPAAACHSSAAACPTTHGACQAPDQATWTNALPSTSAARGGR